MAITICDKDSFKSKLIPHFIDGDRGQLDPCFAAFKRIDIIKTESENFNLFIAKLKLIGKASIGINFLIIDRHVLSKMSELYRDREVNFMLNKLKIDNCYFDNISDEEAEFINKINPNIFAIKRIKWAFENIKTFLLLNCTDIDVNFDNTIVKDFYLRFIKTPIQLFDFNYNQQLTFEWKSIKIFIQKNKIEKINLLKTNKRNFLFIPSDTISSISCSGFREILSADDTNKQFADFDFQHQLDTDGFIVPMRYSSKISIKLDGNNLDYLNRIKQIKKYWI